MCYGDFPAKSIFETTGFLVPRGVILNRDLSHIEEVDLHDPAQIEEYVSHAYYDYGGGKDRGLHPYEVRRRSTTRVRPALFAARRRQGLLLDEVAALARQGVESGRWRAC